MHLAGLFVTGMALGTFDSLEELFPNPEPLLVL